MVRKHIIQTATISAIILAVVMALDWLVNVALMPGHTPYTPISTLVITLLVTPAAVYFLIRQNARVERAQTALADEHAARLAAVSASEAKSRFLAMMSHELRTPLNAIIGYAEIIEEESGDRPGTSEDAQRVQRAGKHLLHLIDDILDHARLESGEMAFRPALTQLAPLLTDVADSVRAEAHARSVALHVECAPNIGMAYVDARRLRQCMHNLAANAVKFTPKGAVTLRLTAIDAGAAISFEVIDTGIGIASDMMGRLFRPFTQGDAALTRGYDGTGLGLALTKSLAERMGGHISAESVLGEGSTFRIVLPRVGAAAAHAEAA